VNLDASAAEVRLEVRDNGRGIRAEDLGKRTSFGVRGMRERVRELGGIFEIGPAPGGGTSLTLRLPLPVTAVSEVIVPQ
jgi:two-component system sensor histidine kinase UhpB